MLEQVRRACRANGALARAYLVRKHTAFFQDQPLVVIGVASDIPWYKPSTGEDAMAACEALLRRVSLPEFADLLVAPVEPRSRLQRRLRRIEGAEVYRRA